MTIEYVPLATSLVSTNSVGIPNARATTANFPATVAQVGAQSQQWLNLNNVKVTDTSYAQQTPLAYTANRVLNMSGFGLGVPSLATVTGAQALFTRRTNGGSSATSIFDDIVQLLLNGNGIGANKADPAAWMSTEVSFAYGGANDNWSYALTPAVVNDATFGVRLRLYSGSNNDRPGQVNSVTLKVFFILPTEVVLVPAVAFAQAVQPCTTQIVSFSNVASLAHFDGVVAVDEVPGVTWSLLGSAATTTSAPYLGARSLDVPAASCAQGAVTDGRFTFGLGDFTVEFLARLDAVQPQDFLIPVEFYDDTAGGAYSTDKLTAQFYLNYAAYLGHTNLFWYAPTTNVEGAPVPNPVWDGSPHWFAYSRAAETGYLFVDGKLIASAPDTTNYGLATRVRVGSPDQIYDAIGKYDEFRVTKNVGRYTRNYAVPTQPFYSPPVLAVVELLPLLNYPMASLAPKVSQAVSVPALAAAHAAQVPNVNASLKLAALMFSTSMAFGAAIAAIRTTQVPPTLSEAILLFAPNVKDDLGLVVDSLPQLQLQSTPTTNARERLAVLATSLVQQLRAPINFSDDTVEVASLQFAYAGFAPADSLSAFVVSDCLSFVQLLGSSASNARASIVIPVTTFGELFGVPAANAMDKATAAPLAFMLVQSPAVVNSRVGLVASALGWTQLSIPATTKADSLVLSQVVEANGVLVPPNVKADIHVILMVADFIDEMVAPVLNARSSVVAAFTDFRSVLPNVVANVGASLAVSPFSFLTDSPAPYLKANFAEQVAPVSHESMLLEPLLNTRVAERVALDETLQALLRPFTSEGLVVDVLAAGQIIWEASLLEAFTFRELGYSFVLHAPEPRLDELTSVAVLAPTDVAVFVLLRQ